MSARDALDRQHRARQVAIQNGVASSLGILLDAMPDLGEQALAGYVDGAYFVVVGGQSASASTAAAYVTVLAAARARARGRQLVPVRPVDVDTALTRSGVLVEPESRSLVAPVLRARALVAEGLEHEQAVEQATSYADALSSNDVQAAQRVGLNEGADAAELKVHGWRKGLGPEACSWCRDIARRVFDDPEQVPMHDRDRCGVEPELDDAGTEYVFDGSDIPF